MKKHAFLLGVYKNPEYVETIIHNLLSPNSNIYIHVNKLYLQDFAGLIKKYANCENIHFTESIKVKWGGLGFLNSSLVMIKAALKNPENQVFHLISGQDVQTVAVEEIVRFFEGNEKNYIEYRPLPDNRRHYYDYYRFENFIDVRSGGKFASLPQKLLAYQIRLGLKRSKLPFKQPCFGSCWWSLQREAVQYIFDNLDKKNYIYKRLKYTFAPDEMICQSLLVNAEKFEIENNNLRYIRWSPNNTGSPELLLEKDFDDIIASKAFFARKVDPIISKSLIDRFNRI